MKLKCQPIHKERRRISPCKSKTDFNHRKKRMLVSFSEARISWIYPSVTRKLDPLSHRCIRMGIWCFKNGPWRGRQNKNERLVLHSGTFETLMLEFFLINMTLPKCVAPCFCLPIYWSSSVLFTSLFTPPHPSATGGQLGRKPSAASKVLLSRTVATKLCNQAVGTKPEKCRPGNARDKGWKLRRAIPESS